VLGTHADVSYKGQDFTAEHAEGAEELPCVFCEKAKPLPFSAYSAFSAVQSAVSDNGEYFTADGAKGAVM